MQQIKAFLVCIHLNTDFISAEGNSYIFDIFQNNACYLGTISDIIQINEYSGRFLTGENHIFIVKIYVKR